MNSSTLLSLLIIAIGYIGFVAGIFIVQAAKAATPEHTRSPRQSLALDAVVFMALRSARHFILLGAPLLTVLCYILL